MKPYIYHDCRGWVCYGYYGGAEVITRAIGPSPTFAYWLWVHKNRGYIAYRLTCLENPP